MRTPDGLPVVETDPGAVSPGDDSLGIGVESIPKDWGTPSEDVAVPPSSQPFLKSLEEVERDSQRAEIPPISSLGERLHPTFPETAHFEPQFPWPALPRRTRAPPV